MSYKTIPVKDVTDKIKLFIIDGGGGENYDHDDCSPKISRILHKLYISSKILELSTETRYVAFVLFYRYIVQYHKHFMYCYDNKNKSNRNSERQVESISHPQRHLGKIAVSTLFLACKIMNENRRIRDVINMYHILRFDCQDDQINDGKKEEGGEVIEIESTPPPIDEAYWIFKEEIVKIEQQLLRVLNFDIYDLSVSPYRIVVSTLESIINYVEEIVNGGGNDNDEMNQHNIFFKRILATSWRYINDSIFDIDLLTITNSELACAALQFSLDTDDKSSSSILSHHINQLSWWEWVDVSSDQLGKAKSLLSKSKDKDSFLCSSKK